MTDEGTKKPAANGTSANGAAASSEKETSAREAKYKLWAAILTLVSVIVGFGYTTIQLLNQGKDLQRIEQNFRNMNELKTALMMPLEGVWDFRAEYEKYFGESELPRHGSGKAIFLWYGERANIGYTVYIGAGVHERGETEAIVTGVSELFIGTDELGIPQKGSSITGGYIARTSSNPKFKTPSDTQLKYRDGEFTESPAHNIIEMRFKIKTQLQTDGTIIFRRPPPQ